MYVYTLDHMHYTYTLQLPMRRAYYKNVDVIVLAVDSNERERMYEFKSELWSIFGDKELKKSTLLLVMANKQEHLDAMSVQEITQQLDLHKLGKNRWRK